MFNETPTRPTQGRPGPKRLGYTAHIALRLTPALHRQIRAAAQTAGVSMNALLVQQLAGANAAHDDKNKAMPA